MIAALRVGLLHEIDRSVGLCCCQNTLHGLRACCDLCTASEFGDAAGLVPIGNVDVGLCIDVAAVGSAEKDWRDIGGLQLIVGPLRLLGIVAEECDGGVVAIKNGGAAF